MVAVLCIEVDEIFFFILFMDNFGKQIHTRFPLKNPIKNIWDEGQGVMNVSEMQ